MILTSAATRADGSLGLRFATPELKADEKTVLFELQGQELKVLLAPKNGVTAVAEVKQEFDRKTPGQRLRAAIFVWWQTLEQPGDFDDFYRQKMEVLISYVKEKLPEKE